MEYLFYALMGIALLIVCELIVFMIIDWIRGWIESNSNRIHIKMVKTGNKYFHLHTIEDVKGVTSFPEIRSQSPNQGHLRHLLSMQIQLLAHWRHQLSFQYLLYLRSYAI